MSYWNVLFSWVRVEEDDRAKLENLLNHEEQDVNSLALPDSLLVSRHSNPVVQVLFQPGPPLRLFVLECGGKAWTWEWVDPCWTPLGSSVVSLPFSLDSFRELSPPLWDPQTLSLLWPVGDCIWRCPVNYDGDVGRPGVLAGEQFVPTSDVATDSTSTLRVVAGAGGLWLLNSSVQFWSFRLQRIYKLTSPQACAVSSVMHAAVHPVTQELLVLCFNGQLDVYALSDNVLKTVVVSILRPFPPFASGSSDISCFLVQFHAVALVHEGVCRVYDLRSGILLEQIPIPFGLEPSAMIWRSSEDPACLCGLWGSNGVWEFCRCAPVTHAESLVNSGVESIAESALAVCREWGLDRWEAYHALLLALSPEQPASVFHTIATRMQNPGLLLALSEAEGKRPHDGGIGSQQHVYKELSFFSAACVGALQGGSGTEAQRVAARGAFQLFTPLNRTLRLVLDDYLGLINDKEPQVFPLPCSSLPSLESLSPGEVVRLEWPALHLYSLCDSELLLTRLLQGLGLGSWLDSGQFPVGSLDLLLLEPDLRVGQAGLSPAVSRSDKQPALFELICKLLYMRCPDMLLPFVRSVASATPKTTTILGFQDYYQRALAALPPIAHWHSPSANQAAASAALLCSLGRSLQALRTLLGLQFWKQAVALVGGAIEAGEPNTLELFTTLLHACIERPSLHCRLPEVWPLAPPEFRVMDLLRVLNRLLKTSRSDVPILIKNTSEHNWTVDTFRPQILQMLERETLGEQ